MKCTLASVALVALLSQPAAAFVAPAASRPTSATAHFAATLEDTEVAADAKELERQRLKQALLGRLGAPAGGKGEAAFDPVLADPLTKDPLALTAKTGVILGGSTGSSGTRLTLRSAEDSDRGFEGRTNSYINLLEPASDASEADEEKTVVSKSPILSSLQTFIPPPLRSIIANATNSDVEYIPMRDLFTSPSVSFAYERGWRQGFAAAGFPGADKEFELAQEYFAPVGKKTLVDMSCATGLFTRRFVKASVESGSSSQGRNVYDRVIACDYSDSMLTEARRRIRADSEIASSSTKLDLVRCDVAKIPMKTDSIDAFHAGAAMHCWPEIEKSLSEIHRVLTPGGRYFATTFLGTYFNGVASAERATNGGADLEQSMQAFQYFPSVDYLRDLLLDAGFEKDNVQIEVVGAGCVIIRCEK